MLEQVLDLSLPGSKSEISNTGAQEHRHAVQGLANDDGLLLIHIIAISIAVSCLAS